MNDFPTNKNNVGLKYAIKWGGRDNTVIPKMIQYALLVFMVQSVVLIGLRI